MWLAEPNKQIHFFQTHQLVTVCCSISHLLHSGHPVSWLLLLQIIFLNTKLIKEIMHNCSIVQSYPIVTWLHQTQGRVGIETYMYTANIWHHINWSKDPTDHTKLIKSKTNAEHIRKSKEHTIHTILNKERSI